MKVFGFIPARGGSKGLPGKNIRLLNGKPMIYYTLKRAFQSKLDRIVVSSDNSETIEISERIAEHLSESDRYESHFRPANISGDNSTIDEAVMHYLSNCGQNYTHIIILQPTSPIRKKVNIDQAIKLMQEGCKSIVEVAEPMQHPGDMIAIKNNKVYQPFNLHKIVNRQNYEDLLFVTGALYALEINLFMKDKKFIFPFSKLLITEQIYTIDIDTQDDFFIAESIMIQLK